MVLALHDGNSYISHIFKQKFNGQIAIHMHLTKLGNVNICSVEHQNLTHFTLITDGELLY